MSAESKAYTQPGHSQADCQIVTTAAPLGVLKVMVHGETYVSANSPRKKLNYFQNSSVLSGVTAGATVLPEKHHCLFLGVNTNRLKIASLSCEISNFLYNLDLNKPCLRRSQSPLWISTCISAA